MNERKLAICHVITRMIVGGAQENTLLTILDHAEKGHKVTLVTGPSPGPEGELLKLCDTGKFELITIPELVREVNPGKDFIAWRKLCRFFRERNFDVVHTHASKAGISGRAAAWREKVPFVVHTIHGQAFHPYEKTWKNHLYIALERYAAKRCHKIYAVAQAMIESSVGARIAPREKYMVVYSGMLIDDFLSAVRNPENRKKWNIPAKAPVIGAVARLFPLKGYEFFLPAAFEVARKRPDVHFLIVGNGIMRGEMDQKIAAAGLTDRFHFTGLVAPSEVPHCIVEMDQLWHLSLREGLPRSVVQSLACGVPAIGYHLDGTPEVLFNGETGYCVTPESVEEVVVPALELLDNPEKANIIGKRGQAMVREKFDWRKMGEILEEEYYKGVFLEDR